MRPTKHPRQRLTWTALLWLLFASCELQHRRTPLMFALEKGGVDAIQALLDAGADRFAEVRIAQLGWHVYRYDCSSFCVDGYDFRRNLHV